MGHIGLTGRTVFIKSGLVSAERDPDLQGHHLSCAKHSILSILKIHSKFAFRSRNDRKESGEKHFGEIRSVRTGPGAAAGNGRKQIADDNHGQTAAG